MNTQERDQLNQFLKQLVEVTLTEKNTEAETMIREAATRQPDAAYLLVQRSLLLEQALNEAKTKISELQNQLQKNSSASSTGSFFGNDPWAQASSKGSAVPGAGNYQIPAAGNAQFSNVAPQNTGVGSSFFGNVATTAAGVAAGSFLFQGIENLMGHHQSGGGQQPFGEQQSTDQTVINNYYGDSDQPEKADNNNTLTSNDNDSFFDDSSDLDDSDWG
jgi:hypothetical protein